MSAVNLNNGASGQSAGKEFLIVIVVVFSSLSFVLGFFVGKNNEGKRADAVAQGTAVQTEVQARQSVPPPQTAPSKPDTAPAGDVRAELPAEKAAITPSAAPESRPQEAREMTDGPQEAPAKSDQNPSKQSNNKAQIVTIIEKPSKTGQNITVYTVQLGALKSPAEARALKAKFAKKGYKTYITIGKNKDGEKIYKVRTGGFEEKKDAETLSLKLKKNDGLNAFVTVRNE